MSFFLRMISAVISLSLSIAIAFGVDVNSGITEPEMPKDAAPAEVVEYYNNLVNTTKTKKYIIISETFSHSVDAEPVPGSPESALLADIETELEGYNCDSETIFTDELFCSGTSVSTKYNIYSVIPPSYLYSDDVLSADIEENGQDYLLTIVLRPETDSAENPAVFTPRCTFDTPVSNITSIMAQMKITADADLIYPATKITAAIGTDGVLKELVTELSFDGTVAVNAYSDAQEASFTGAYTISGCDTLALTFSYDF